VGDVIESQGRSGTVQAIQIFNTILLTPQGDTVILPNGATSNGVIINKAHPKRALVDIQLELDSNTDFEALRQAVTPLLRHDDEVPDAPAPQVELVALKPGATMTVSFRAYAQPGQEDTLRTHLMARLQQWFAHKPLSDAIPGK
jgi:small conductance mechanosensitive channel